MLVPGGNLTVLHMCRKWCCHAECQQKQSVALALGKEKVAS